MLRRVIIITSGALLAGYCAAIAPLTLFGKNPATLHLTKFFLIGYAAVNGVLTPFGISGIIGGSSRKKALIRTFVTFHWWLSTFVLIGVNVFNIVLAKRDKGDTIRKCQADLAKGRPDVDFSARCRVIADNDEKNAIIETFSVGGAMLVLGIILLIVGMREYNYLRSEEEDKSLIARSVKMDPSVEESLSPSTTSSDDGTPDPYEVGGRYNMNNIKQPNRAFATNVDLTRRPTNVNVTNVDLTRRPTNMNGQYSGPVRYPTSPRNKDFIPPSYQDQGYQDQGYQDQGLTRNQTIPILARYPANNGVNVTRQQTIGNAYTQRNYVGTQQQPIYPMAPQRSLSTRQYVEPSQPPQPSYVTQMVIPPPKPTISEIDRNNDYDYYIRKPYQTTTPYLTRMGMK